MQCCRTAEEVCWRGVGLPPVYVCGCFVTGLLDDFRDGELGRDDATLVVDPHQDAHGCVEDYPGGPEAWGPVGGLGDADAG